MLNRFIILLKRCCRGRSLGLNFIRAATFQTPTRLRMANGKFLELKLPQDKGTHTAFVDILLDDCYGLVDLPNQVGTVVDIGCHAGLFSIAASRRWPGALIHSYDPNPHMQPFWSRHADQIGFVGFQQAVGKESGFISLVPNPESVQTRTDEKRKGDIAQVSFEKVLDRMGGHCDLVKLDCEGAEWQILQDFKNWQKVRFLRMEFHLWAGYTLPQLLQTVSFLGFKVTYCQMSGRDFGLLSAQR
jgi:FkbM family methyltransferase